MPSLIPTAIRRAWRRLRAVSLLGATLAVAGAASAVTLADAPLFSTVAVPGNLVLALSVEYPTANTPAYFSTTTYTPNTAFLGYFDPDKCYRYIYDSTTPASSYFTPYGAASTRTCSSSASVPLWSGNYLNWASTQTLDAFRWVLTGGNRDVDTTTSTILQKTYHSGQDGGGYAPNKSITSGMAGATPFSGWTAVKSRIWGAGVQLWLTSTGTLTSTVANTTTTAYTAQSSAAGTANASTIYAVYVRVKVCDSTIGLESNCTTYGSNAKPEGLMQQYASKLRYAAFGYLNDGNVKRDGGVLRAPMKYIGPTQPVPGSASITNSVAEWSASTGVMAANPNASDATATTSASSAAGYGVTISQSGVMNYLNKFGYSALSYKQYDPVSELYYAALRYLKNLGNVSSYSSLSGAGSTATMAKWLDGFPVVQTWTDPIAYSCQKNFILGIGDVNTHRDANLYGSTLRSSDEPSMPSEVSADTSINVKTATDMVGTLEGISSLGSTYVGSTRYDTYFIAGLAYDAHTNDIRTDLSGKQTVNTYWMDVLEGQTYVNNNIYYLATKYGGFTVPAGFSTYASTNSTSTIAQSAWHTNSDSLSTSNLRPDNYFTANNADVMKSGLTNAFSKIASELSSATTTAFSAATRKTATSGNGSYAGSYDPSNWTGKVVGSSISYASDGTATLTAVWDARALLETPAYGDRKIVTCCDSAGAGLPFTASALSGTALSARTNYASFASVPGVTSQSASNFLKYLRGDHTQEVQNGGAYRNRSYRLGDIVNAKVNPVSTPSATYYDNTNAGYSSFKRTWASRKTVVYAGANDGMLHAFDGALSGSTMGTELFAYVPSFTYGDSSTSSDRYFGTYGLVALGNPSFTHHYYVDATPLAFDIDLSKTTGSGTTTPNWRTVLIGGLGKGGKGYYALDVTDPSSWTSESAVAGKVMWEFTDSRMGYSFGAPVVVKTAKYGWVVLLSSGYNNSDGKGYLFVVNPRNGNLLEAIATPSGSTSAPINLAPMHAYVVDYTDYTADAVYAGDLQGHVWRFDLTPTTGSYSSPTLLATLTNAAGTALPITTRPMIGVDSTTKKRYIMVGTGQLLADTDISNSDLQGFFALVDGTGDAGGFYTSSTVPTNYSLPITRNQLTKVSALTSGVVGTASPMGWYYDFTSSSGIAERMVVDGDVSGNQVAFAVTLPNGDACSPAGSSRYFSVAYASATSTLLNSSGTVVESLAVTGGVATEVAYQSVDGATQLVVGDSAGNANGSRVNQDLPSTKRLNWREVSTVQ